MSQENVELYYRAVDAFNRRDLDGFLALMDEQVQSDSRLASMEGGYHGHDGARRWWQDLLGGFPDFTIEVVEVRDLGDLTIALLHNRAHGADSDTPVDEKLWQVAEWRHDKVVWWSVHLSEAEALKAVGLRT
jgi:ketosteroid isomerase-like protein